MEWHHLLFAHWPVEAAALRSLVPQGLAVDTFEGQAWLGVVPFGMRRVRPRGLPALPWISAFPELNLRTYVVAGGKPGVWFFSLDAGNPVAVRAARLAFHLPYFDARMSLQVQDGQVTYASRRTHRGEPPAGFQARYRPSGPQHSTSPGTLEDWLTARYCLYAADRKGTLWRGEIHHPPWPLQEAEMDLQENSLTAGLDLRLPDVRPLLHYAHTLDVVAWPLERVAP